MNNKIKKMLSLITALALQASLLVSAADAAAISSKSWSKDFNNLSDVTYSKWVNATETGLDCTADCKPTFTLDVLDDDTDPVGHGKVIKLNKDSSDTEERFFAYQIPEISSGRFVFEFDVKTKGGTLDFTANPKDWYLYNHLFSMNGNSFTAAGGINIASYEMNKWYKVRCVFDRSDNSVTINIGENSAVVQSNNSQTKCMKFIIAGGPIYFDNFKLYTLDETVSPAVQLYNGSSAVGNYLNEEVTDLTLQLKDSAFASLPDITMTDLGTDIINDSDDVDFAVTGDFSDGKIQLSFGDVTEVGNIYKISVPEGTKDIFGRNISNNEIVFYVAENGGWVTTRDFTESFTKNVPAGDWGGDTGFATVVDGPNGTPIPSMVTGSNYTDGAALALNNANINVHLGWWGSRGWKDPTKGKLHFDIKLMGAGGFRVNSTNLEGGLVPLFYNNYVDNKNVIDFLYQAPSGYPGKLWETRRPKLDENIINYTVDVDNLRSYVVCNNGNQFSLDTPIKIGSSQMDWSKILSTGKGNVRGLNISGSAAVDYLHVKHEYQPAVVKSVTFVNEEGLETSYSAATPVSVGSKVKIAFSESMKTDTLSKITVKDADGNAQAYTGEWNASDNSYTLTFNNALRKSTTYSVDIPGDTSKFTTATGAQNEPALNAFNSAVLDSKLFIVNGVSGKFTTSGGEVKVNSVAITDENGEEITDLAAYAGNTIKVVLTGSNTTDEAATVYLAYAGYNGTALSEMNFEPVTFAAGSQSAEYTFTISDKSVLTKMKAFALKDMENIIPYCEAAIAK